MHLTVKVFGTLQQQLEGYDPTKGMVLTVPDKATVADLVRELNLDFKAVGMVSVNGVMVASEAVLEDGAEVNIFQPISGG